MHLLKLEVEESLVVEMVVDCCLRRLRRLVHIILYCIHLLLLLFYDALKSSHITFILFYHDKVEKVTVGNVGTYDVGFWGGGELLVPSDYDETGGVAKVDVSKKI